MTRPSDARSGEGTAILTLTRGGTRLAERLATLLAASRPVELHVPARFALSTDLPTEVLTRAIQGPLADRLAPLFATRAELIFIGATGIAVRLIAPLLQDKARDPAVLVLDEAGRFVIPLLSGHLGGANASARRIADLLGATAVLTTASDVQGSIAVDLLGRELGWRIEATRDALLHAAAAVVNGERVIIIEEDCGREWWPEDRPLPANLETSPDWSRAGEASAYLWVTRKPIDPALLDRLGTRLVVYRPPASG